MKFIHVSGRNMQHDQADYVMIILKINGSCDTKNRVYVINCKCYTSIMIILMTITIVKVHCVSIKVAHPSPWSIIVKIVYISYRKPGVYQIIFSIKGFTIRYILIITWIEKKWNPQRESSLYE